MKDSANCSRARKKATSAKPKSRSRTRLQIPSSAARKFEPSEFEVIEVRRIEVEELNAKLLNQLGFEDVQELRSFVRQELVRQFEYHQHKLLRSQVVELLTKDANWEMPEKLVRKQTSRELQRLTLELQRSGYERNEINRYLNAHSNNAREATVAALREHFVLEKIAEELKIEPTPQQYDAEIELLAEQNDVSPRRIRARLERTGQMDALRNQIIEREVIDRIVNAAKVTDENDTSFLERDQSTSNVTFLISGELVDIPEAQHDNDSPAVPGAPKLPEAEKGE